MFLYTHNEVSDKTTDVQADLSVCWVHMSESTFSHVVTQLHL